MENTETVEKVNERLEALYVGMTLAYRNSPNEVKKLAWSDFGRSDRYYRDVVMNPGRHSLETVLKVARSLKSAYQQHYNTHFNNYRKQMKEAEDLVGLLDQTKDMLAAIAKEEAQNANQQIDQ